MKKKYVVIFIMLSIILIYLFIHFTSVFNNNVKEQKKNTNTQNDVIKIEKISDYNNPIVPEGFKKVETEGASWELENSIPKGWNDGLVIEDELGNQFVWVPVLNKYENQEYLISENEEEIQLFKYGGFYISRFEAGIPKEYIEHIDSKNIKVKSNNINTNPTINIEEIPKSKKGEIPWNYIDWEKAKINAVNMYKNNKYVYSDLITENQWKYMAEWISNDGYDIKNSKDFGNYSNVNFEFSGYYSIDNGKTYKYGENVRKQSYNMILSTGATERNKTKNIYDLAGNLAEYVDFNETSTNKYVMGGYYDNTSSYSILSNAKNTIAEGNDRQGFRICLYIL